jgi:hypothetical protein
VNPDDDVLQRSLAELRSRLERAFSLDTASPGFAGTAPSTGHCAVASLVLQELMGGELLSANVQGKSHWFNRLRSGPTMVDVDITGDQFGLPELQIAKPDTLYSGTRVRTSAEANRETVTRAILLAERANLERAVQGLRELLGRSAAEVAK